MLRAIEDVWSEDGVLVLMDLGSAVLSAELALDLLDEERRARVLLTAAPLVEGAVAAAVAAGLGDPLEAVAAAARSGLAAKASHLGEEEAGVTDGGRPDAGGRGRRGGPDGQTLPSGCSTHWASTRGRRRCWCGPPPASTPEVRGRRRDQRPRAGERAQPERRRDAGRPARATSSR